MRERLTLSFIVLTVLLLLGAGAVRTYVLRDLVREETVTQLSQQARLVSTIVKEREASGQAVDETFLSSLVASDDRLEYAADGGDPIVVHGADYDGADSADADLSASVGDATSSVTVGQSHSVSRDVLGKDLGSIAALLVLVAIAAGLVGFVLASVLSAPFQRLAVAAAALGRGRFDLDLPKTRIPEARAISDALRSSALQLEDRVQRERDFAEHASHVLRTPLTGVRLELEDLTLRDDIPEDAKESAARSLASIIRVDAVAGDLVELTRRGSLVAGAELPLADLATQLAQRWADRLASRNRVVYRRGRGRPRARLHAGPDRARHRPAARRRRPAHHRPGPDRLLRRDGRPPPRPRPVRGARRPSQAPSWTGSPRSAPWSRAWVDESRATTLPTASRCSCRTGDPSGSSDRSLVEARRGPDPGVIYASPTV